MWIQGRSLSLSLSLSPLKKLSPDNSNVDLDLTLCPNLPQTAASQERAQIFKNSSSKGERTSVPSPSWRHGDEISLYIDPDLDLDPVMPVLLLLVLPTTDNLLRALLLSRLLALNLLVPTSSPSPSPSPVPTPILVSMAIPIPIELPSVVINSPIPLDLHAAGRVWCALTFHHADKNKKRQSRKRKKDLKNPLDQSEKISEEEHLRAKTTRAGLGGLSSMALPTSWSDC